MCTSTTSREGLNLSGVLSEQGLTLPRHDIELSLPVKAIINTDAQFAIYSDGEKLGELRISRGSLDWKPRGRRKAISIQWERFDRLVQETCS